MTQPQGALLVGSVNFDDAELTIRTAARELGGHLRRIPDGEVGARFHWIYFQADVLGQAEGLERIGNEPLLLRGLDGRPLRIAEGVDASTLTLPPLGYAEAAIESYAVFRRLREEGEVAPGTRFQVSLPTPLAVVGGYFRGDDRIAIEPVYRDALRRELDGILEAVPHDDLATQWDVAVEFAIIESGTYDEAFGGAYSGWFEDAWPALVSRLAAEIDRIPAAVEVGVHLCYGDAGEKHFFEPKDAGNLTRFANDLFAQTGRGITWLHLPVPIERDDEAYFAPLGELALPEGTELYLGLVHREDGPEGAGRRIAAARAFVPEFGVATECGIGRAPEGTTEDIFRTHAEVARPW